MKLEEWIDLFNTTRPFVADEIAIFILSKLLGYGIAIILRNTLWTTTQGDDMMGCDVYFTYCGEGNFVPLKNYDPAEEDKLLNKYYPKIAKEKQKKVGGRARKGLNKGKSTPGDDPQPAGTPGSDPQPSPAKEKKSPTRCPKSPRGVTNSHLQRVPTNIALEEVG